MEHGTAATALGNSPRGGNLAANCYFSIFRIRRAHKETAQVISIAAETRCVRKAEPNPVAQKVAFIYTYFILLVVKAELLWTARDSTIWDLLIG